MSDVQQVWHTHVPRARAHTYPQHISQALRPFKNPIHISPTRHMYGMCMRMGCVRGLQVWVMCTGCVCARARYVHVHVHAQVNGT